ncbi:hypothetical protein DNA98_12950 [Meiothermus sp. Pnk-1]|nr:hypothetical protein DNA98_12950 [Meiothermus sp. Pnk-1]
MEATLDNELKRSGTFPCPLCGGERTVSSRHAKKVTGEDGMPGVLRRGRRCLECGARWATLELVVVGSVVRDGRVVL